MAYDLTGKSDDWHLTNVLKKYGIAAIDSLFTDQPYVNDPIIPAGTPWDFTPLAVPSPPPALIADIPSPPFDHQPNPDNGSNNWAVNGSKTATGYPILCGDPHLGLNLPSLWYEIQLVSPTCNVSGVSLPGVPTIIIGFNRRIAWSQTNVEADVLDWYSVQFRNGSHDEYFYNNEWKKTTKRTEVIKVRGSKDVIDTVVYTLHGPVVTMNDQQLLRKDIPLGFAMRWEGHDGALEMKTFIMLNRAGSYDEYVKALSYFGCPAQNFIYADADNNIAIWVNGKFPLKWKDQGKFLMDGSKAENDWQGFLPHDHDPHVKNPPRNFVSSANQDPADSTYPYYLHWAFAVPTRAQRINERLGEMNRITADSMRMLQDDNKNMIAAYVLPSMISGIDAGKLNDRQRDILQSLQQWNYSASAESVDQGFFNEWWNNLKTAIWYDELGSKDMLYPEPDISMQTVKKNINQTWIDDKSTPQVETLNQLMNQTFVASIDSMQQAYGTDLKQWDWADIKKTRITHLLRIPAFSETVVKTGGAANMVNATSSDHGPSWRMIVELGTQPKAYGIYPGGQSGNPGSPFYDNMVERWRKGEQNELLILRDENEDNPKIIGSLRLKN
jgi:penicillin amidase